MEGSKVTQAWRDMLSDIVGRGRTVTPFSAGSEWKGRTTKELLAYQTVIPMDAPAVMSEARNLGYRFMLAEAAWILSGDNRVSTISPYSKIIKRFSDDGVRFFGAYGPPFVEQLSYVVETLRRDAASRQAVVSIWRPQPRPTKDVPCTLSWQYLIREGRLDMVATMRSSDAWTGWPYDVFAFSMTAAAVAIELRATPSQLRTIGVPPNAEQRDEPSALADLRLGDLYLTAGSQHLYQADLAGAEAALFEENDAGGYAPLDLVEFKTTDALTEHLWALSRGDEARISHHLFGREFVR